MSTIPKYDSSSKYPKYSLNTEGETAPMPHSNGTNGGTNDSGRLSNFSCNSKEEENRLGFTDHVHRKAVKKGFNFTIMVIGQSGLGKSTLVNSLFQQELYKDREVPSANQKLSKTTKIEKRQIELDERGVKLRLTIVDTPGFGDSIDCTDSWKSIEEYIDGTFEQYFKDECGLNRKNIQDNRIHCCLYFISPYGRGLSPLDIEIMRRLQKKVNIVPIIAKADTLTVNELKKFKNNLMENLEKFKIDTYRLPECDSDEEEDIKKLDKEIKAVLPFAVIGSNITLENELGKKVRGRQYPWGTVEVQNSSHCDFSKLRLFLLKTHMQDLKDMTLEVHYENYRAEYITDRMCKRQNDRSKASVSAGTPETSKYSTSNGNGTLNGHSTTNGTYANGGSLYRAPISGSTYSSNQCTENTENISGSTSTLGRVSSSDQNNLKVHQMVTKYQSDSNSITGTDSPQLSIKHQQAPPPIPVLANGSGSGRPVAAGN